MNILNYSESELMMIWNVYVQHGQRKISQIYIIKLYFFQALTYSGRSIISVNSIELQNSLRTNNTSELRKRD